MRAPTIDEARFQGEALQTAFAGEETVLSLAEADCYTLPTVTEDPPQIKEVTDRLAALSDFTISYAFGENKEVIDRTVLWSWYRQKKDGTLYLDEKAVAAYVKSAGGKVRHGGRQADVPHHGRPGYRSVRRPLWLEDQPEEGDRRSCLPW